MRVPKVSFMVGEGRLFARSEHYPITTRESDQVQLTNRAWYA